GYLEPVPAARDRILSLPQVSRSVSKPAGPRGVPGSRYVPALHDGRERRRDYGVALGRTHSIQDRHPRCIPRCPLMIIATSNHRVTGDFLEHASEYRVRSHAYSRQGGSSLRDLATIGG